jgi:hypothetical protein
MTKEDDVRKVLTAERAAKLYRAIRQAWADVQQDIARYPHWPRTRAGMIFERLRIRLQEQFATDTGVHFVFADETMKMVFDSKLVARCKKADSQGLGHNIPTDTNDLFCEQGSFFEAQDKIEIVYVLNTYATDISKVLVQARDGDVRLWAYEIDDAALSSSAPVEPLPQRPMPPITSDAEDLVQPRAKPIKKEESDKDE